jgi:hypothetical protein
MIVLRRDIERLHVRRNKQEVWRTFDPQNRADPLADGFGALSALDEIRLSPGAGVTPSPDQEALTITYVLEGALAQGNSTRRSEVIRVDEFQCMTTGRVRHNERNESQGAAARVFRLSLHAAEGGLACTREHKLFPVAERRGVLRIVASRDGRRGSLRLDQDALVHSAILEVGLHLVHELKSSHRAWLHIVCGEAAMGEHVLFRGDGAGVTDEIAVSFTARENSEILLIDLGEHQLNPASGLESRGC